MLGNMVQNEIVLYAMAILVCVCVVAKLISAFTVRRLVRASREIYKSNHRLMKLIKSKFEHATLVSERVHNVEAFVEKYVYEYKVLGVRLHTWNAAVKWLIGLTGLLGLFAVFESYRLRGFGDLTIQYIQWTGIFLIFLFLLQFVEEERGRLGAVKNYIVEYLENVCAHRYEKQQLREERVAEPPVLEKESEPVLQEMEEPQVLNEEQTKSEQERRIRAILEEFLA